MNTNHILEQLVDLTSITDLELLENGLLDSLVEFISPVDVRIIQTDSKSYAQSSITLRNNKIFKEMKPDLNEEQLSALSSVWENFSGEYTKKTEEGYLSVYAIHKSRTMNLFLFILTADPISSELKDKLFSLIKIFQNFYNLLVDSASDPLTGLLNRKTFDKTIDRVHSLLPRQREVKLDQERRQEASSQYWLVMIDIDHFKSINDTYGHLYGDDVLILLAQILKNSLRSDDLVFRFGGEEFVLIIQCSDIGCAREILDRILNNVSSYDFSQVGRVTVSAGVVCIDGQTFSATLLDYADKALYHSKDTGRNRATFYSDLIQSGEAEPEQLKTGTVDLF